MSRRPALGSAVALMLVIGLGCAVKSSEPRPTGVLLDFKQRVDQYAAMQRQLQSGTAELRETADPAVISTSMKALAARIRTARPDAHQGDIFTPRIATALRRAMNKEIRGAASANTRAAIRADAPPAFRLQVNVDLPEGAPLPTVPANVLAVLPPLPEELEYRIFDVHLVLRDSLANIVVDYLFNVMCEKC